MSAIVQINFAYSESREEFEAAALQAAPLFGDIPGLRWKVWLVDEAAKRAGGIYLFETREQARAYAEGPLVTHLRGQRPDLELRLFDTLDEAGALTRAPV